MKTLPGVAHFALFCLILRVIILTWRDIEITVYLPKKWVPKFLHSMFEEEEP